MQLFTELYKLGKPANAATASANPLESQLLKPSWTAHYESTSSWRDRQTLLP